MGQRWLSIVEYARTYSVSDMTVRRRIKNGKLQAQLKEGKYYIPVDYEKPAESASFSNVPATEVQSEPIRGAMSTKSVVRPAPTVVESEDKEKYQTVYAKVNGSVAAPTAGLHFTDEVIKSMQSADIDFAPVTLHVGAGTFLPVKDSNIDNHHMHSEHYYVCDDTIEKIKRANEKNVPVICVGTTSFRAIQSFAKLTKGQNFEEFTNKWIATDLFIYPETEDYRFKPWGVNGIMTNFHQPESTLIMLISSLVGYRNMQKIYTHAIKNEYRFYSYGDSSLLWFD